MRLIDRYRKPSVNDVFSATKRSRLANPTQWLIDALSGGAVTNNTGQTVSARSALSIASVHACVRVTSEGLATMPLRIYSQKSGKKEVDSTSISARLIKDPNPYQTGFQFRKQMIAVAVLKGNSYAYIFRDKSGNPVNIFPIQDGTVTSTIVNGELYYQITGEKLQGIPSVVSSFDMIHFKGLCINSSFEAISPIVYHAQTLGIDLAGMQSLGATYKAGAKKIVLTSDNEWDLEQQKWTKEGFDRVLNNASNTVTVPSGVKIESLSLSPAEAEFISAHNMSAQDIARMFGVPASIIGADSGAIKASVEQDWLNFISTTLAPWAENIEQELEKKLLPERDKGVKEYKHVFNSLMKADINSRADYFTKMFNIGAYTANEIRDLEDLNPLEFGDMSMYNVNQFPASEFENWAKGKTEALEAQAKMNNNPQGTN